MKPDYKNWMPKGMVLCSILITAVFLVLFLVFGLTGIVSGTLKTVLFVVFLVGTLAIACAKRNPAASFVGIDRWGKEYASFNKPLCENNAGAEGVSNVRFQQGDATKLDFPDESFDAVMSNYVYHNIPGDRQAILMETLRVLKKGGTFAIHDIFSRQKYGDMQAFIKKLKDLGFESAELIDTTDGRFMTKKEASWMLLSGSALLVGKK